MWRNRVYRITISFHSTQYLLISPFHSLYSMHFWFSWCYYNVKIQIKGRLLLFISFSIPQNKSTLSLSYFENFVYWTPIKLFQSNDHSYWLILILITYFFVFLELILIFFLRFFFSKNMIFKDINKWIVKKIYKFFMKYLYYKFRNFCVKLFHWKRN